MSRFIEIVDDSEEFEFVFVDPATKQPTDAAMMLRVLSPDQKDEFERAATKYEFIKGSRHSVFDAAVYVGLCLDAAIRSWRGIVRKGEPVDCTRDNKLRLPEPVKQEVMRLCVGREVGLPGQSGIDPNRGSGSSSRGGSMTGAPRPVAS